MKNYITNYALRLMRDYFTPKELADLTSTSYKDMCGYFSGRYDLPLHIAFFVLDYTGCVCMISRSGKYAR